MGKFATFREMGREERLAAFEAAALLLAARMLVALVPLRFWRDKFGVIERNTQQPLADADQTRTARLVRQAVGRAMRNAPIDFICLPQALAARWMLLRRGVESALSIGARRSSSGRPEFHAWLTVGEYWVTGDCEPSGYRILAPENSH